MRAGMVIWLAAAACVAAAVACDPGTTLTFENATTTPLTFFFDSDTDAPAEFSLEPLETKKITVIRDVWNDRLIARDPAGEVVFDQRITWDELKRMGAIVVEPDR